MLNKAIAREMQASIRYVWQHVQAYGMNSPAIRDILRGIATTEMKHAESIAERLAYLGSTPATKPDPILVGETLSEMLKNDVKAEEEAVALYKNIVKLATDENDPATRLLFMEILEAEEEHHDTLTTLLQK